MITIRTKEEMMPYKISTRLLMNEALEAGYELTYFPSSPSTQSGITRGVKDNKELFFKSTATALVPAYGVHAAENKALTYSLLSMNGVSTPATVVLGSEDEISAAYDMLDRHQRLVVKPVDTNHGDGITVNVTTKAGLEEAVAYAKEAGGKEPDVIIQQQVDGDEYRFLVVDGRVLAVASRRPPFVIGDGVLTVQQLLVEKNKDPRRSSGHASELTFISIEDVLRLKGQQFLEQIPKQNEVVQVLDTSNLSKGGEAIDVTDIASSRLKKLAEDAARHCFLGIAGVDIITSDITANTRKNSYVIEVNLTPGIRMHQFPGEGTPRNVAKEIFKAIEKTARPIGKALVHIGRSEEVILPELLNREIPARIDTGATVTSLWASKITETAEGLSFVLFDEKSPYYTGEVVNVTDYGKRVVSSSMGQIEVRYKIKTPITLHGRTVRATVTLADRSTQIYPILVGRNVLKNKFIVDVARGTIPTDLERIKRRELNDALGGET